MYPCTSPRVCALTQTRRHRFGVDGTEVRCPLAAAYYKLAAEIAILEVNAADSAQVSCRCPQQIRIPALTFCGCSRVPHASLHHAFSLIQIFFHSNVSHTCTAWNVTKPFVKV
jgi:hypothetical protein